MFGAFGAQELIILLLIVLLLFGGKKIPEIAKGLGKGIKEFKSAKNEDDCPRRDYPHFEFLGRNYSPGPEFAVSLAHDEAANVISATDPRVPW